MPLGEKYLVRVSGVAAGLLIDYGSNTSFRLLDSYRDDPERPVLGQMFEDAPDKTWSHQNRVPAWFANLLHEGPLRNFLADELGVSPARDAPLLAALGTDLPGSVTVEPTEADVEIDAEIAPADPVPHLDDPTGIRFSIAGYQLKLSMVQTADKGFTLAGRGELGDFLMKLPSTGFPSVPENEFATMTWARAVGIDVPETELVEMGRLDLPHGLLRADETWAFKVRRFDRGPSGRVHIEDLNQVVGGWPAEKYKNHSYESLGKLVLGVTGSADAFAEYVRRLVFVVAVGNEDAHLKNWSLIYRDGRTAELAPAYDLVSTITYSGLTRGLGLSLGGTKAFDRISRDSFRRLADVAGIDERTVLDVVDATVERIHTTAADHLPRYGALEKPLRLHFTIVPLLSPGV